MEILGTLQEWFTDDGTLSECRRCGKQFERQLTECFNCHSEEIAHYEFE